MLDSIKTQKLSKTLDIRSEYLIRQKKHLSKIFEVLLLMKLVAIALYAFSTVLI